MYIHLAYALSHRVCCICKQYLYIPNTYQWRKLVRRTVRPHPTPQRGVQPHDLLKPPRKVGGTPPDSDSNPFPGGEPLGSWGVDPFDW